MPILSLLHRSGVRFRHPASPLPRWASAAVHLPPHLLLPKHPPRLSDRPHRHHLTHLRDFWHQTHHHSLFRLPTLPRLPGQLHLWPRPLPNERSFQPDWRPPGGAWAHLGWRGGRVSMRADQRGIRDGLGHYLIRGFTAAGGLQRR